MTNQPTIVHQVFEAVEHEGILPIGEKISLEYLSVDDDGIFETPKSWSTFVRGNFQDGEYWRSSVKESTLKKWCYPLEKYRDKFAVKVGVNKYQPVNSDDLEFTFDFEPWYSRKSVDGLPDNFCTAIEIYVTATIKS